MRDGEKGCSSVLRTLLTVCYFTRITKEETIIPHISALAQGERWPRCVNVETSGRGSYKFSEK